MTVPHCEDGGGVDLEFGGVRSWRGRRGRLCLGAGIGCWRTETCRESREDDDVEQLRDRAPEEERGDDTEAKNGDDNKYDVKLRSFS